MSKFNFSIRVALGALCLALSLNANAELAPSSAAGTAVPLDRQQLEKRLESVKTLLEKSTAAKQIAANGDPASIEQQKKAMALWDEAKLAIERGDLALAQKRLVDAPKIFFGAARLAAPEKILEEKLRSDFRNRRDSVIALLDAQKRISAEKGKDSEVAKANHSIEAMLAEADSLATGGKFTQARATADKAYLLAKATVGQMRSGDTLVRSLSFASKADEYKYEIDRNDSLAMLFKVLIEQSGRSNSNVDALIREGADLRSLAEKKSAEGDYAEGVRLLEESTARLVRAIRSAGIYIPG